MMWLRLLDQAAFRALTGGILYALLVMSVDQIARLAERSMRSRGSSDWRAHHSRAWAATAQVAGALGAIGFIFALVLEGSFAANDVGLVPINWPADGPWLAVLIPGTLVLVVFFWAPYFSRVPPPSSADQGWAAKGPAMPSTRVPVNDDESATLLNALTDEASLAIFRAASMPLLGPYWGIWLGLAWNLALRSLNQRRRPAPMSRDRRGFYYIAAALDWLSATLFVVTGSLWACLLGRLAGHVTAQIIYRWSIGRRLRLAALVGAAPRDDLALLEETAPTGEAPSLMSGEDERQNDERGEHDRRQDGDALQIP